MSDDARQYDAAEPPGSQQVASCECDAPAPLARANAAYTGCNGDPQRVGEVVAYLRELHVPDATIKDAFGAPDLTQLVRASGELALSGLGDKVLKDVLTVRRAAEAEVTRIAAAVEAHAVGLADASVVYPQQAVKPAESKRMSAQVLDLSQLATTRQSPPAFVIPEWLPEGYVTLLAAHGEGGKSQIALYFAICLAAGLPVFGTPSRPPRRVVFYSCEDGLPILNWRVQQYCSALSITADTLDGWLYVIDAGNLDDPELFVEQRGAVGKLTRTYDELRALMAAEAIDIAVIDNASDVFAANEISRPAVRAFVRSLQHLLPEKGKGAVLLLGHVNRSASTSNSPGQQYSGSTAWHNSVRSRWELTRGKADEAGAEDELLPSAPYVLKRAKNNYAASDACGVQFRWNHLHGVILPDEQPGPMVQAIDQRNAERQVLAAFAEADATGQRISPNVKANNNAAKVFRDMGIALPPQMRDMKALSRVLRALQLRELLTIELYINDQRKQRERWTLTEKGLAEVSR